MKRKREIKKRYFSFAFLLAIFGNVLLAGIGTIAIWGLIDQSRVEVEALVVATAGFIASIVLLYSFSLSRTRVLIHELKHAIVVRLTGNKIKDFHIEKDSGHVKYALYTDRVHFAPLITLAPYFYPLFSLPVLFACVALEDMFRIPLALALGFSLGIDTATAISEIHPHQTDFKQIRGGIIASLFYLAGFHICWFSICTLWILDGRESYVYGGYVLLQLIEILATSLLANHSQLPNIHL